VPGFGNGTLNTPPLIEAADTGPFFHNNSAATLEDAIRFYTTRTFAKSPSGAFGGAFVLDRADIADIAAFLRALNALENARSALAGLAGAENNTELLQAIVADIKDGIEVLKSSKLAPAAVAAFEAAAESIAAGDLDDAKDLLEEIPSLVLENESETVAGK
jgi:hypothetical protein